MVICQLGIGIEEENPSSLIEIFPNPADKQFQISFKKEISGNTSFSLTDMYSREIKSSHASSSNKPIAIEVSDLESGIYLLKIEGKDFSFTEKMIVRH
jgi:hypothetical protein